MLNRFIIITYTLKQLNFSSAYALIWEKALIISTHINSILLSNTLLFRLIILKSYNILMTIKYDF